MYVIVTLSSKIKKKSFRLILLLWKFLIILKNKKDKKENFGLF